MGYGYEESPSGLYTLTYWGKRIAVGSEGSLWRRLHRECPSSVEHALTHEGYRIIPNEELS